MGIRRVLFLAGAIVFVDTLFFAALTPLLPHYADRFDLTKSGAGLLAAAYPLGVLVGGVPSGYLAARAGVKPTAVTALCLIAGTSIVFGVGDSIALLDAARFTQGLGSACAWTAALSWLVSMAPSGRRGALIGSALGVAIAGAIFGPVAGAIASVAGTGPVFAGVGGLCLVVAVLALRTPAPPVRDDAPGGLTRALQDRRIVGGLWLVPPPGPLFRGPGVARPLAPFRPCLRRGRDRRGLPHRHGARGGCGAVHRAVHRPPGATAADHGGIVGISARDGHPPVAGLGGGPRRDRHLLGAVVRHFVDT